MWFNKCVPLIVALCLTTSCSARVRNPVVNQVLEEIKALIANHALTINPVVSKLNHIDNQMQLMSSKFDRLFEANELIKTNERLIMDKISGIDVRLSAIDHSIRTELTVGQNASMTHQSSNFDRMEQNLDSKIRKVLNVASNSYEETKSIRTGLEQSELISSSQSARSFIPLRDPSSGHETQEMVRGLREQLTIHNYDVTRKVTTLEETAIKLTAYLNAIEEHQIILNDNFVTFSESLTESLKRPPDNPDTKGTSDKVPGNVTLWQSEFEAKLDKKLDAILNKFAKVTKCSKSVQMLELPAITCKLNQRTRETAPEDAKYSVSGHSRDPGHSARARGAL
ncbi:hypothetical protein HDE_06094 [Halotydeus destructor]|nr:hypothetical protein HDE_06094 [Halotydeus destructor]